MEMARAYTQTIKSQKIYDSLHGHLEEKEERLAEDDVVLESGLKLKSD